MICRRDKFDADSCLNCISGCMSSGGGVDEPPWVDFDCKVGNELPEDFFDAFEDEVDDVIYEKQAAACGKYTPIMLVECACCKNPMVIPEHRAPIVVYGPFGYPAYPCSDSCADTLVALFAEEERKLFADMEDEEICPE